MPEQSQPQSPEGAGDEGISSAMKAVNSGLLKIKEIIANLPFVPDAIRGQIDEIIQNYHNAVDGLAQVAKAQQGGGAPVQEPAPAPEEPARPKMVPARGPRPLVGP